MPALLGFAALSGMAALGLFVRDIRIEAARLQRPWWRGELIVATAVWVALALMPAAVALLIVAAGIPWSGKLPQLVGQLSILLGVELASIAANRSILKRGGDFLYGNPALSGASAWCQARLGAWWLPRMLRFSLFLLATVMMPGFLFVPILMLGSTTWFELAHAYGWEGPQLEAYRGRLRAVYLRQRALEASAEFRRLQQRNAWIGICCYPAFVLGGGAPFLLEDRFKLYDVHDPRVLWVAGLAVGLVMATPASFVLLVTLSRGRARFAEYVSYWEQQHGGPIRDMRRLSWLSLILVVVSLIAILLSADFSHVGG